MIYFVIYIKSTAASPPPPSSSPFSPSFSVVSFSKFACQVTQEGNDLLANQNGDIHQSIGNDNSSHDEDDFEFIFVRDNCDENEVVFPIFLLFNKELLDHGDDNNHDDLIRLPLRSLFIDDCGPPSSSASESNELEGVSSEMYYEWTPSTPLSSRCRKSNLTGSLMKQ